MNTSEPSDVDITVRYAETDQMGVVHHRNYLTWFELGRDAFCPRSGYLYTEIEAMGFMLMEELDDWSRPCVLAANSPLGPISLPAIELGNDLLGAITNNDTDLASSGKSQRLDDSDQHRASGNGNQGLRQCVRQLTHAPATAGSQNQGSDCGSCHRLEILKEPRFGLPGFDS